MIYLNNAATSWPKPQCVIDTLVRYAQDMPDGQMRSSLETEEENIMEACRRSLSRLLGVKRWDRIFFTSGATESANLFLAGEFVRALLNLLLQNLAGLAAVFCGLCAARLI